MPYSGKKIPANTTFFFFFVVTHRNNNNGRIKKCRNRNDGRPATLFFFCFSSRSRSSFVQTGGSYHDTAGQSKGEHQEPESTNWEVWEAGVGPAACIYQCILLLAQTTNYRVFRLNISTQSSAAASLCTPTIRIPILVVLIST